MSRHDKNMTREQTIALLVELGLVKDTNNKRRIVVQLGKYGDIFNILPAIRVMAQQCGQPVRMMVASQFADAVTGLSYVEPIIFEGDFFHGFNEAVALAKLGHDEVIVSQVCGKDYSFTRVERHFNMESWRLAGMGKHFFTAPLVLDNRDFAREKALAEKYLLKDRHNVLVNLSGKSSPLYAGPTLLEWFRTALPDVSFVDVGSVRAEHITDLLGLYDRAVCLITCDTATLHLARSHPIPVIALCAEGWNGSRPVVNPLFKCTYNQVWRHLSSMCHLIRQCTETHPKMIRLWQDYKAPNEKTANRELAAYETWIGSEVVTMPFNPRDYPTTLDIGDTVDAPELKAVFDRAVYSYPKDIIVFANNDICILPQAVNVIRAAVNQYGCFYSPRIDVDQVELPFSNILEGDEYAGADLFAMTADWWKACRDRFPNLYLGFEGYDFVLRALMLESGLPKQSPVVVHQRHDSSHWKGQNDRPGQKHNRSVCRKWAIDNGYVEYLFPEGHEYLFKAL